MSRLITRMAAVILERWHLPYEQITGMRWRQFVEAYESVLKEEWDEAMADIQGQEFALVKAIGIAFGAKHLPEMPDYNKVHKPLFAKREDEQPKRKSRFQELYLKANNLER
jgi:hypothetical protein